MNMLVCYHGIVAKAGMQVITNPPVVKHWENISFPYWALQLTRPSLSCSCTIKKNNSFWPIYSPFHGSFATKGYVILVNAIGKY